MIFVQAAGLSISVLCLSSSVLQPWEGIRHQPQPLTIEAISIHPKRQQMASWSQDNLGDAVDQEAKPPQEAETTQEVDPLEEPSQEAETIQEVDLLEEQRQQQLERQRQQEINDFVDRPASSTEVIILGQPQNFPYVVVIPGGDLEQLDQVQAIVSNAFITRSRRGRYIHAASFPERLPAEALSSQLRYLGFDSQVAYIRNRPSP